MDLNLKGNSQKLKLEKKQQDTSHLNEIKEQLTSLNRRYGQMQANFEKQENLLDSRNKKWKTDVSASDSELDYLKKEIDSMKDLLSRDIKVMENIISRFKDAAKLSDYNLTQEALENWKVESMITKDRFKKILLKELESRML